MADIALPFPRIQRKRIEKCQPGGKRRPTGPGGTPGTMFNLSRAFRGRVPLCVSLLPDLTTGVSPTGP